MADRFAALSNKQGPGYPAEPVWRAGGGWSWGEFGAAWCRPDRRGGSIRARIAAAPGQAGQLDSCPAAHTENQALSARRLGQVARIKSHSGAEMADFRALGLGGRSIASFQTGGPVKADHGPAASGLVADQGGVSPLSIGAAPPYPGRARQTQDLEKPARGPASIAGRTQRSRSTARNRNVLLRGSGVRAARERAGSGGAMGWRCGRGAGIGGFAGSRHFRLDQGKAAKLGGERG